MNDMTNTELGFKNRILETEAINTDLEIPKVLFV